MEFDGDTSLLWLLGGQVARIITKLSITCRLSKKGSRRVRTMSGFESVDYPIC